MDLIIYVTKAFFCWALGGASLDSKDIGSLFARGLFLEVLEKITVKCSRCRFQCEHLSTFYQPKAGKQPSNQISKSKNPKKKKKDIKKADDQSPK